MSTEAAAILEEVVLEKRTKYAPFAEYKASAAHWLPDVPSHWEMKRLRFAVEFPKKSEIRNLQLETPVSFVPMEAVGEYGGLDLTATRPLEEVFNGYTYFADGDVIVAKITPCFENGKGAIAHDLQNGVGFGTTELYVLRATAQLDTKYLFYLTIGHDFRKLGAGEMYGAGGQKRVPEEFIRELRHPLPPLSEQRAIASFLDVETSKIDTLVKKKQRLIELLQEKRTALISHAVTKGLNPAAPLKDSGVEWLGQIPAHWTLHQVRRLVTKFVDYRGRTPTKTDSGVPLITAGAIRDGVIDHSRCPEYILEDNYDDWMTRGRPELGDIVITTEAPLAEVGQVDDTNVAFAQRVILFKGNLTRMLPNYMRYYYLSTSGRDELLSRASGSTASGIRADRLKMSLVPTPPIQEQQQIVEYLEPQLGRLSAPIAKVTRANERLREYRTALISAAVTGKIDVRNHPEARI